MSQEPSSEPSRQSSSQPGEPRGPLRRVIGLSAAIVLIVGLAFVVARPHADPEPVAVNLAAQKGPRPPGLKILLHGAQGMQVLDPATELHRGDALRLVVRSSAPRYLVVRVRDGKSRERVFFPRAAAGPTLAALVQPDQALPDPLIIDDTPGKITLTALFGKQPFAADDSATVGDLEIATVNVRKAP